MPSLAKVATIALSSIQSCIPVVRSPRRGTSPSASGREGPRIATPCGPAVTIPKAMLTSTPDPNVTVTSGATWSSVVGATAMREDRATVVAPPPPAARHVPQVSVRPGRA
jgi:hypothetical protein